MCYLGMPRAAIGDLREEHGTFFRLSQGQVARITLQGAAGDVKERNDVGGAWPQPGTPEA